MGCPGVGRDPGKSAEYSNDCLFKYQPFPFVVLDAPQLCSNIIIPQIFRHHLLFCIFFGIPCILVPFAAAHLPAFLSLHFGLTSSFVVGRFVHCDRSSTTPFSETTDSFQYHILSVWKMLSLKNRYRGQKLNGSCQAIGTFHIVLVLWMESISLPKILVPSILSISIALALCY